MGFRDLQKGSDVQLINYLLFLGQDNGFEAVHLPNDVGPLARSKTENENCFANLGSEEKASHQSEGERRQSIII